jgi:hypothetical protein
MEQAAQARLNAMTGCRGFRLARLVSVGCQASGQTAYMDSHRDVPSVQQAEDAMKDDAGRMQDRLDDLGAHVKEARKARDDAKPGDEELDAVAGDASERSTSSDDPVSAVGNPADADHDEM